MKAVVYRKYGGPDVLHPTEVDRPKIRDDEVMVRVRAAGVAAGDWHLMRATFFVIRLFFGLFGPRRPVLGFDVAGVVEEVGKDVTRFQPGDEVFGGSDKGGAWAEYMRVPERLILKKPANLSFEKAAVIPQSGWTALQGLRDHGKIREGQTVLVNGASGGVGLFAVQLAKHFGAHVTGICSTGKMDLVEQAGADRVIDYTKADYTESDALYDLIFDLVGNRPLKACKQRLEPGGMYVAGSSSPGRALWCAVAGGKQVASYIAKPNRKDLQVLKDLCEAGALKPFIDRSFPLEETADAMRYFDERRVRGKIVITV